MSKPDESELKSDYCAGLLSIQKVAIKHKIPKSTLVDMARKNQWNRKNKPSKSSVQNENGRTVGRRVKKLSVAPEKVIPHSINNSFAEAEPQLFNPEEFGISEQQALFAESVVVGKTLTEAYRLAGYLAEGNSAHAAASRLFRNVKVSRAIRFLRDQRQRRLVAIEGEIIHQLVSIASADPNEISQLRRVNCRYCWGEDNRYQWRDVEEFNKAEAKALTDGKPEPDFGGVGFVDSSVPNPDCPKCGGEGTEAIFFTDTTMLDGPARWLFAGVKQTMNGLEVKMANQDAARRELLKYIQMGKAPVLPDQLSDAELDREAKRLRNEKLQAEIENIRTGKQDSNLVVVHNALQIPGAIQQTQEDGGDA